MDSLHNRGISTVTVMGFSFLSLNLLFLSITVMLRTRTYVSKAKTILRIFTENMK